MCVSFYPRRFGFSAFEQGSEVRLYSRAFAVPLVWQQENCVPARVATGRLMRFHVVLNSHFFRTTPGWLDSFSNWNPATRKTAESGSKRGFYE
jgi:hypothetical protein